MKLRTKFIILMFLGIMFLLTIAIKGFFLLRNVDLFRIQFVSSQKQILVMTLFRANVRSLVLNSSEYLSSPNMTEFEELNKNFDLAHVAFENYVKASHIDIENEKLVKKNVQTEIDEIKILEEKYMDIVSGLENYIELIKAKKNDQAKLQYYNIKKKLFEEEFIGAITKALDREIKTNQEDSENLGFYINSLSYWVLLTGLVIFVLIIIFSFIFFKLIIRRLTILEKEIKKVKDGNFNVSLSSEGNDEISSLSRSFIEMVKSLILANFKIQEQQKIIAYSSKMSTLGEVSASIAHEINTPLAAIQLYSETINDLCKKENVNSKKILNFSENIESTCNTISNIINGLKLYSRSNDTESFEFVDIKFIIENTLELIKFKLQKTKIKLKLIIPEIDIFLNCRPTQISQLLLNLFNNSIDAIDGLEEKWIEIEIIKSNDYTQINFTDSGKGIPPEVYTRLMTPFFTTKKAGVGTGLGLSISRNIIESHGGTIECDNECKNTRFIVKIPNKHLS